MRLQKIRNRVAAVAVATGLVIMSAVLVAPTASADHSAPPPAYGGPVSNCPGNRVVDFHLLSSSGVWLGSMLEVWYRPAPDGKGGTYCAIARDNINGPHHMEVVIRRADFQTTAWDSSSPGTYDFYAGGMEVFGAAAKTVFFFARVTVNGVNYEARAQCDPTARCFRIDG